jgi:hypothetical protein
MTARDDIATVAGQLVDLTRTLQEMGRQHQEMRDRAISQLLAACKLRRLSRCLYAE